MSNKIPIFIWILGAIVIIIGSVYIYQGINKSTLVRDVMRDEKVTYLLHREDVESGKVIDTGQEAQKVADTIRAHRHDIATTYEDLLKGGQYDPTDVQHLIYGQAMNLENYLYMGVLAFGLTTVVLTSGITLFIVGITLILIGLFLQRLQKNFDRLINAKLES
ncbi:hypothetical protein ACFLYM_02275 [Chloroflexota bacterium]